MAIASGVLLWGQAMNQHVQATHIWEVSGFRKALTFLVHVPTIFTTRDQCSVSPNFIWRGPVETTPTPPECNVEGIYKGTASSTLQYFKKDIFTGQTYLVKELTNQFPV